MVSEYKVKRNTEMREKMASLLSQFKTVWPDAKLMERNTVDNDDYRVSIQVTPKVSCWIWSTDGSINFSAKFDGWDVEYGEVEKYARTHQITEGPRYNPEGEGFVKPNKMNVFRGNAAKKWVEYYEKVHDWVVGLVLKDKEAMEARLAQLKTLIKPGVDVRNNPDTDTTGSITIKKTNGTLKVDWTLNRATFNLRTNVEYTMDCGLQELIGNEEFVPQFKIGWDFLHMAGKIRLIDSAEKMDHQDRTNIVRFEILEPFGYYSAGSKCESVISYDQSKDTLVEKVQERQALLNELVSAYYPGFVALEQNK